jgi:hypothetical protein
VESLIDNRTWMVVGRDQVPKGSNILNLRWIFKIKRDASGVLEKYKARACVRGFKQKEGIDYDETFASTVGHATIRLLFAIAACRGLKVWQMDVVTAFLYSTIDKEIYIEIPEGYELVEEGIDKTDNVLKLLRGIYGLKQAGYLWGEELKATLIEIGMRQSTFDPGLYTIRDEDDFLMLTVFVDDILIASTRDDLREKVELHLQSKYKVKILGEANSILGAIVTNDTKSRVVTIQQTNYLQELGEKLGVDRERSATVPIQPNVVLEKGNNAEAENYRSLVGSISYAAIVSRPDLSYAVNYLGRYSAFSNETHLNVARALVNYAYHTRHYKLVYEGSDGNEINLYVDASHIKEENRGVTGYVINYGKCPIIWRSKKQKLVTLSTAEAEIVALCDALREISWLRDLIMEIGLGEPVVRILEDNQACITISKNAVVNDRTRHIMVKTEFIRWKLKEWKVDIKYIESKNNIADIFTKGLDQKLFEKFRDGLGVKA